MSGQDQLAERRIIRLPDLTRCALEPIHIPGAIQPHGALLAAWGETRVITHASANLAAILGSAARSVLGRTLEQVLGEPASRALAGDTGKGVVLCEEHLLQAANGARLHLRSFRADPYICVDLQPAPLPAEASAHLAKLHALLETLEGARDCSGLCALAVRGLREITGYDRVMAYRFHEDGTGEVIAESLAPGLAPYLGLHYPASDVPPQARQLYLRQRVGAVADSAYTAVPLLAGADLRDAPPVDLTHSALRSVSPVHRAYMRNMQTAASLTIALTRGTKLWGMLVCHHGSKRIAEPGLRAAADILGQVMSLLIGSLSDAETAGARLADAAMLAAIARQLAAPRPLAAALSAAGPELLQLLGATGVILRAGGEVVRIGRTPPHPERVLDALLSQPGSELLAIEDLGLRYPAFRDCIRRGSGALLLQLPGDAEGSAKRNAAILWFRPEQLETIAWGGNPAEHVTVDSASGQLSPRASFAALEQIVAGHSARWTSRDLEMARCLADAIETAAARQAKAALRHLNRDDALTGLPNRALLQERLNELGPERHSGAALLFLGLDRFKAANNSLGTAAGDALLVETANRLRQEAGARHLAARLGGDEFAVLCLGLEAKQVLQLAERIRASLAAPFSIRGRQCHMEASIGIAFLAELAGIEPLRAADAAMVAAKQAGGNRVAVFEPGLADAALHSFELEMDLREALQSADQFILMYQPIFQAAGTNRLAGFEALIRWQHPRNGLLPPGSFIPLAEKSGLILPLGEWVLARRLHAALHGKTCPVSVNISAPQLAHPDFRAGLMKTLESENLPASALCLEITETMLTEPAAFRTLAEIRAIGTNVAIDDFGMGYSSLSYLRQLPADIAKFDRSFLQSQQGEPLDPNFINAASALARAAGKTVLFEGVETAEHLDLALAAGAELIQGFYFDPPLSAQAALRLAEESF
jgi:diguanylate cyclase (GGDEF)-like protein